MTNAPLPENSRRRSLRVLLADDSYIVRTVVTHTLTVIGHRVQAVADGTAALRELERDRFDLVFLDGQMPELDGAGTARAIRAHRDPSTRALAVVGLTAGDADERAALLAAGMDMVVEKPVTQNNVAAAVEAVLARRDA